MSPNDFRAPSSGFTKVMGLWNTRESLSRIGSGSSLGEGKSQSSLGKKALLKPQALPEPTDKRASVQQWNQLLTTTTQILRAKKKIRMRASRVRLRNIAAKKLTVAPDFTPPVHPKEVLDVKLIKEALNRNFVFDEISDDDLMPFIDAFESVSFAEGDFIVKQGDPGSHFYIVNQGKVRFYVEEEEVSVASRGDSFGEVALLYTCPQAASVMVTEDGVSVFRVGHMLFRSILKMRTEKLDRQKAKLLEAMECFKDVGKDDLRRLSDAMVAVVYKEGDVLSHKDDKNPPFCVVQEGEIKVTDVNLGATKYHQMNLSEGASFGDLSISMDLNKHSFGTATAASKGLAYSIDRETFQKIFGSFSRLVIKSLDKKKLVSCFVGCRLNLITYSRDGSI
jgi:cAMP-dependent protein kinase regulator